MFKIVDATIPAAAPTITTEHPSSGNVGATLRFAAQGSGDTAVLSYHWDFGDGVSLEGSEVNHAFTQPGEYNVNLTAAGLSASSAVEHFQVRISGHMPTTFDPPGIKRYQSVR